MFSVSRNSLFYPFWCLISRFQKLWFCFHWVLFLFLQCPKVRNSVFTDLFFLQLKLFFYTVKKWLISVLCTLLPAKIFFCLFGRAEKFGWDFFNHLSFSAILLKKIFIILWMADNQNRNKLKDLLWSAKAGEQPQ